MPLYEFVCQNCDSEFELIVSFSATDMPSCPDCDADNVQRKMGLPAIHFKGSGWYINDSKKSNDSATGGKTADSSSEDSKSDKDSTSDSKETKSSSDESKTESTTKSSKDSESKGSDSKNSGSKEKSKKPKKSTKTDN